MVTYILYSAETPVACNGERRAERVASQPPEFRSYLPGEMGEWGGSGNWAGSGGGQGRGKLGWELG